MIDSIYTATSGLQGHQRGLSTISNNVANMNTPGFMGSHIQFTDLFSGGDGTGEQASDSATGGRGLDASRVSLDLRPGEIKETGRDLDLALTGAGFFVLHDKAGTLHYSRNGSFEFDDSGLLINKGNSMAIQAYAADGGLSSITLDGRKTNPPVGTTSVVLSGSLSSTDTEHTIEELTVFDKLGGQHVLKLAFTNTNTTAAGTWGVAITEGTTALATGQFLFNDGVPSTVPVSLSLPFAGMEPMSINFSLDADTTGDSSGTTSTLAMKQQDGHSAGQITVMTFDAKGVLKLTYSNGQSVDGPKLALAEVPDDGGLVPEGSTAYFYHGDKPPKLREAGDDLRITAKSMEMSNVDLTSEFSALIIMQRGYQASSQVLSTANDMLQQLFEMKGRR